MALSLGADGVEMDVHLARDGVPVVIHDSTLNRTGLTGGRVSEMTSAELSRVGVGRWFNLKYPGRANEAFNDERVSTLAEVLTALGDFTGLVYIELKCNDSDFSALAHAVCDVIRSSPLMPQVIIKSFKLAAIPEIRHHLPEVETAVLIGQTIMDYLRHRRHILAISHEFGAQQISMHYSIVTRKLAALANEMEIPVTIWTTDSPKWIKRCAEFGVRSLITDDPGKLLAARNHH